MKTFKQLVEELSPGLLHNISTKIYSGDRKLSKSGKLTPGKVISFKQKEPT